MDKRNKVPKRWKTYTAGLGACGLVAAAAATDGSAPGGSPPESVVRAVEVRPRHPAGFRRQFELELVQQLELQLVQQLELELLEQLELELLEQLELQLGAAGGAAGGSRGGQRRGGREAVSLTIRRRGARPSNRSSPQIEFLCEPGTRA